jgi:hypothetical protein
MCFKFCPDTLEKLGVVTGKRVVTSVNTRWGHFRQPSAFIKFNIRVKAIMKRRPPRFSAARPVPAWRLCASTGAWPSKRLCNGARASPARARGAAPAQPPSPQHMRDRQLPIAHPSVPALCAPGPVPIVIYSLCDTIVLELRLVCRISRLHIFFCKTKH